MKLPWGNIAISAIRVKPCQFNDHTESASSKFDILANVLQILHLSLTFGARICRSSGCPLSGKLPSCTVDNWSTATATAPWPSNRRAMAPMVLRRWPGRSLVSSWVWPAGQATGRQRRGLGARNVAWRLLLWLSSLGPIFWQLGDGLIEGFGNFLSFETVSDEIQYHLLSYDSD